MSFPALLVCVRHGESVGNKLGLHDQSLTDTPNHKFALTLAGSESAFSAGIYLRKKYGPTHFDARYTSTFKRTQETMKLMMPDWPFTIDSRLNEHWRGVWHTLGDKIVKERYPDEAAIAAREGIFHHRPLGGESGADVELRIHSFLQSLRMDHSGQRVLIAAHGIWLLFLWRILNHHSVTELEFKMREGRYHNGSITTYRAAGDHMEMLDENVLPEPVCG